MKKLKNNSGSVSIYLILIFTVLLSLVLLLIEGARKNAVCTKIDCAMDLSVYSVFAEYNRELLDQYDVFFIDTSYGKEGASIERTGLHLKTYLDDNFKVDRTFGLVKDLLALQTQEVTVIDYSLASDEAGAVFKKQAVSYMKDLYGVSYVEKVQRQFDTMNEHEMFTRDIEAERLANQSIIDNYPIPKKKVGKDKWEDVKLDNPADAVNATRGNLFLVIPQNTKLSNASVNLSNYISHRSKNVGSGLNGREKLTLVDEIIFNEYMLKKAGCFTNTNEDHQLQYEVEYILKGKSTDVANLKAIVNQLLLIREIANVTYIYSDQTKCNEAEALAAVVSSLVLCPELTEPVKHSLLFAWAYAESVYDVKKMLSGGRVPLLKSANTWHYSFSGMFQFSTDEFTKEKDGEKQSSGIGEGMSYQDYLRVFLYMEKSETKANRMMDLVEMNVRKTPGNTYFRMDTCVDYLDMEALISGSYGTNHTCERKFYYEK